MQEVSRYAVGLDVGTTKVRAVVAHLDASTGAPTIVGLGQAESSGLRKGVIVNLQGPAQAIDKALGDAERMSGYQVHGATLNINGAHILTTHADGMIAVGASDHEIAPDDLDRIEEVATLGKVPPNRETLDVVPHAYKLDGQDNIKDPIGMVGTRLEIDAHVVSALSPYLVNVQKTAELAKVEPHAIVASPVAAAKAVLNEQQLENGVAVIDLGGSTTGVAVYEEGDLQYVGVVPIGGAHITNDLAIGLKTDPEVAEKVKRDHASAVVRDQKSGISVKVNDEIHSFTSEDIDDIVEARLEEIFEGVQKELKKAGYNGRLPSGVVLVGGGSQLKDIVEFTKDFLKLAVKIGQPVIHSSVADDIEPSEYATAIGLMLVDSENSSRGSGSSGKKKIASAKGAKNMVSNIFARFKA